MLRHADARRASARRQRRVRTMRPVDCRVRKALWQLPYADVDDQDRRPRTTSTSYLAERQHAVPGRLDPAGLPAPLPATATSARSCSGRSGRSRPTQLKQRPLPRRHAGHDRRPDRPGVHLRPLPARRDGATRVQVDALGRRRASWRRRQPTQGSDLGCRSTSACSGRARTALRRHRRQRAGNPRGARSSRWTRATARCSRWARCRRFNPNMFAKPMSQRRRYKHAQRRRQRLPADRPRDHERATRPARRSSRSPRRRRSRAASSRRTHDLRRHRRVLQIGTASAATTPAARSYGALTLTRGAPGLLRRLLLQPRRAAQRRPGRASQRRQLQQWARQLGIGRTTGIDLGGETAGNLPDAAWRDREIDRVRSARCERKHHVPSCGIADGRTWSVGRQHQPRRRPGRRAGDAAAARGRLLGDRQRRHGRAPARRAARSTRPEGTVLQKIEPPPARHVEHHRRPTCDAIRDGLHAAAHAAGRHVGRRDGRLPRSRSTARPAPPSETARPTSRGTSCYVPDTAEQADRGRVDGRAGRLRRRGRGARGAPDPRRSGSASEGQFERRDLEDAVSAPRRLQPRVEPRPTPAPRARCCGSTRCCCSRRSGLIACSLVTLQGRDAGRHPGRPLLLRRAPGRLRRRRPRAADRAVARSTTRACAS